MHSKSFVGSAIILIIAGFIARLIGFVYRIYLSNLIGAEGMGLYQLVVPVYTAIVLTVTSGISIAVSKMVAEQKARSNDTNPGRITACALLLVTAAGTLVSLIIFFNTGLISTKLLGDSRTYMALILIAPCIPAVVAASALKGYFYGMQQVMPTALSQVAEQAVKIAFILVIGAISGKGAEYACAIATLSAALGEIANLIVLAIVYAVKRKARNFRKGQKHLSILEKRYLKKAGKIMRKREILSSILKISVPVSVNRLTISVLSAAEFIMIPAMLVSGGLDYKSSMEVYGRLAGMALPLIMFPSIVTSSLATTLVPAISESISLKNHKAVNYRISKSIQTTVILGMIFTAILISYPDEIGSLVYRRERIGDLLYMLSFSCVFIYLHQTLTGVMNGLGKQSALLRDTVIGSILRIAFLYFLVPVYGIRSYVTGLTISYILTSILNLIEINKITGLLIDLREWLIKPGLIAASMVFLGKYIFYFFKIFNLDETPTFLFALSANCLIAIFLMMFAGVFKPGELLKMTGIKNR